jgi:hypothetical protein
MDEGGSGPSADPAAPYLERLEEETMRLAWGERSPEERRRIVLAALIFGHQFEERARTLGPSPDEMEVQRLLMGLMSAVIREFARREGLDEEEAGKLLGEVRTRDLILEFDEALAAAQSSNRSLDSALREAVENRRDMAVWSDHWSSG